MAASNKDGGAATLKKRRSVQTDDDDGHEYGDDSDDDTSFDDSDYAQQMQRSRCLCCCVNLVPDRRRPLLLLVALLDVLTLGAAIWTLTGLLDAVPPDAIAGEPALFWSVFGVAQLPLLGLLYISVLRVKQVIVLMRQPEWRMRQKLTLWNYRVAMLALWHAIAVGWVILGWLALQTVTDFALVSNAGTVAKQKSVASLLRSHATASPELLLFCLIAGVTSIFDVLLSLCSRRRTDRHIDLLLTTVSTDNSVPLRSVRNGNVAKSAGGSVLGGGSVAKRLGGDPFVAELRSVRTTAQTIDADDAGRISDDDGGDYQRQQQQRMDSARDDDDDSDLLLTKSGKQQRRASRKKSRSRMKQLARQAAGGGGDSSSAKRRSLDDSKPIDSGVDGMY